MEETELQISLAEQILKEIVVDDVPFNEALRKKFQPRENEPLRKYRSFVAGLVGCELRHHLLFTALLKKIEGLDEDEKRLVALGLADVYYYKRVGYEEMAALMVGRPVSFKVDKEEARIGEPVLEIRDLNVLNNKNVLGVKDFSLTIRRGEIVGIAGVDGNGQSELVEAISGLRKVESGQVVFLGKDITHASIQERNELGLGHIPEDRQKRGLILAEPLSTNFVIKEFYKEPYSKHGILNQDAIREYGEKIIKRFDVRSGEGILSLAGKLSGGNQQKAIIGREVEADPDLLIAVQPTRGLDVGAIEFIHKELVSERDRGKAVLLVSFELDEIFNLSDRIAVMNAGRLIDIVDTKETDEHAVGLMMAGIKKEADSEGQN